MCFEDEFSSNYLLAMQFSIYFQNFSHQLFFPQPKKNIIKKTNDNLEKLSIINEIINNNQKKKEEREKIKVFNK